MKRFFYTNILLVLGWLLGCSSSDEAPGGGHVVHPVEIQGKTQPTQLPSAPPSSPSANASLTPAVSVPEEPRYYPPDEAAMAECPARIWSKNVPKRMCKKDEDCGDGFCDRGKCAPFWTCYVTYGWRCKTDSNCGSAFPCIEGRCRSCISTAECKDEPNNQNPTCDPNVRLPGSRSCQGVTGSGEGDVRSIPVKP